jgi:outer membrane lipoprotein-sorting protein
MKTLLYILAFFTAASLPAQSADEILKKVEQAYLSIDRMCADYEQTFIWTLADETNTFDGRICTAGGTKFRIENQDQIIVTNGTTLWTLNKRNQQVMIDTADKSDKEPPFLRSFVEKYRRDYNAAYAGEEMLNGEKHDKLILTAKTEDQFETEIRLWVRRDDHLVTKIVQVDINENINQYLMQNINTAVDLPAFYFVLEIPEGYQVVDLRQ